MFPGANLFFIVLLMFDSQAEFRPCRSSRASLRLELLALTGEKHHTNWMQNMQNLSKTKWSNFILSAVWVMVSFLVSFRQWSNRQVSFRPFVRCLRSLRVCRFSWPFRWVFVASVGVTTATPVTHPVEKIELGLSNRKPNCAVQSLGTSGCFAAQGASPRVIGPLVFFRIWPVMQKYAKVCKSYFSKEIPKDIIKQFSCPKHVFLAFSGLTLQSSFPPWSFLLHPELQQKLRLPPPVGPRCVAWKRSGCKAAAPYRTWNSSWFDTPKKWFIQRTPSNFGWIGTPPRIKWVSTRTALSGPASTMKRWEESWKMGTWMLRTRRELQQEVNGKLQVFVWPLETLMAGKLILAISPLLKAPC